MLPRTTILILCYLLLSHQSEAQSFQKILRKSDNSSHYCRKLIQLSPTEYAYLTSTEFYRISHQGATLKQVSIGAAGVFDLQDLIQLDNGQFVIVGGYYAGTQPAIKLTRIDANGQVLKESQFNIDNNYTGLRLVPSGNDHFFLTFIHLEQQGKHVDIMYLNQEFTTQWQRHHNLDVYNELTAIRGHNNGMEFIHMGTNSLKLHHFICDKDGNISEQPIQYSTPQGPLTIIRKLIKTTDGGYLYAGVQLTGSKNEDIVLIKTEGNGHVEWEKKYDYFLGDLDEDIALTDNGYLLLGRTGFTRNDLLQNQTDLVLVKLDMAGNQVWNKAYGCPVMDDGLSLLPDIEGNIFIAGQSTTYYQRTSEPMLIKTDAGGFFPGNSFPHPLLNSSAMITSNADPLTPLQRMSDAALLPNGGIVAALTMLKPGTDEMHPYITGTDAQGNVLWHQATPGSGTESVVLNPLPDGSFLTVTQARDLFFNNFYVTKFGAEGSIDWTKTVYTNSIEDAVMTPDGGYLLCGMEYEDLGNEVRMLCIIKLNNQGEEVWKRKHRLGNKWIYGRSIQLTPENEILVTGYLQEAQTSTSETYLSKLTAQGELLWYKTYPRGTNMSAGNKVIITSSNEYLVTGYVRYPGELHKQDLLLLKTDVAGNLLWEKEYHIDKMDAGNSVVEYGGQYYIAGTTGQPEFGAKESFGLLFRTDINGIQKGFTAFGNKGYTLTCADLDADAQKKFHFMGTVQQSFGTERPFQVVLEPDVVLSVAEPSNDRSVQLYPVPAINNAFALIDHSYTGPVQVSITGIAGMQLFSSTFPKYQPQLRIQLPVAGYVNGTYLVKIKMGNTIITRKMLIGK